LRKPSSTSAPPAERDGSEATSIEIPLRVLVASTFGGIHDGKRCDYAGENVIVTETRVRIPLGPPHSLELSNLGEFVLAGEAVA